MLYPFQAKVGTNARTEKACAKKDCTRPNSFATKMLLAINETSIPRHAYLNYVSLSKPDIPVYYFSPQLSEVSQVQILSPQSPHVPGVEGLLQVQLLSSPQS